MTITEKIIADHVVGDNGKVGVDSVHPGELIRARVDIALANDITAPIAIKVFREAGIKKVFDKDKIALVPDHFTPNKDIESAEQCKILHDFAIEHEITNYFEAGEVGVEHALLPEKGLVLPGDLIIGADSHTCTYGALGAFATGVGSTDLAACMATGEVWLKVPESMKFIYYGKPNKWIYGKDLILKTIGDIGVDGALYRAMEFCGEAIEGLSMDSRFTMANMAIEAGAKNGIITPDETTIKYVEERAGRPYKVYHGDTDTAYFDIREYDLEKIEPQIAFPHLPENTRDISDVGSISIDQIIIGSCTNGRMEDLRVAARVLKGNKAAPYVRLIVIPATPLIYRQTMDEGLFDIFLSAKAIISPPTCGPCLGGHMGILAKGERVVATTNRNFVGRMGHPESEVYLANAAVAAASAVKGRIAHPEEVCKES